MKLSNKTRYYIRFFLLSSTIFVPTIVGVIFYLLFHFIRMERTRDWIREGMDTMLSWREFKMAVYADLLVRGYSLTVK